MKRLAVIFISIGICLIIVGAVINLSKPESNHKNYNTRVKKNNNVVDNNKKQTTKIQFNSFIKTKFASKYFTVNKLDSNNHFANSDLKVEYSFKDAKGCFYLKTLWIKNYRNNKIQIANYAEIQSIKKYLQTKQDPVFKIVGIGGTPKSPKLIFAVPIEEIEENHIEMNKINEFKKEKVETNFFYDYENKILK